MNISYPVKDSNNHDSKLAFPFVYRDQWAVDSSTQAIENAAPMIAALLKSMGFGFGTENETSRECKQANNLWSIPVNVNAKINNIKGDYSKLPNWTRKLVDAFAERKDTSAMVAYEEGDHYVFRVFINNFSADLLGEYCDLYVDLTDNCDDCCCDFRVTASRDIGEDEFPKDAVIVRM